MGREILTSESIPIPAGIKVSVSKRRVKITGPRGTLAREFKHLQLDMRIIGAKGKERIRVDMWFGSRKEKAAVRTVCSHIKNMFTGVTTGFQYKLRFAYAHFPTAVAITNNNTLIEIRNFLGEKIVRRIHMLPGCKVDRNEAVKDEIVVTGNDIERVSQSAAAIHQSCLVKKKDIRKFLDGVYVSEKVLGTVTKTI
eukprot:TRINITY_DN1646_c0_g2_i1.p1 TRINITY_DN1646_c0_g2~~TRINITY_DN1646_c0_g2_i1.p1  ORF type:complete len:214 (-),score=53.97 TRINITY_DN1646_c0_g2_i1:49-636(-)